MCMETTRLLIYKVIYYNIVSCSTNVELKPRIDYYDINYDTCIALTYQPTVSIHLNTN